MSICKYCGAEDADHDYQQLARECYPMQIDRLRKELENCIEVLSLVERPRFVDPDYGEEVRRLGDRIGYGALMSSASASWREKLAVQGYPLGAEFVAGPCYATVIDTLKKARAALSLHVRSEEQP
jgi:hypothetical protein